MTSALRRFLMSVLALASWGCEMKDARTLLSRRESTDGREIRITITEWQLDMSADTVPPGPVSFVVMNHGTDRHELEVEREDEEFEFGEIPVGAEQRFKAKLSPGVYEVYCPLADQIASHKSRGMIARLVVR